MTSIRAIYPNHHVKKWSFLPIIQVYIIPWMTLQPRKHKTQILQMTIKLGQGFLAFFISVRRLSMLITEAEIRSQLVSTFNTIVRMIFLAFQGISSRDHSLYSTISIAVSYCFFTYVSGSSCQGLVLLKSSEHLTYRMSVH